MRAIRAALGLSLGLFLLTAPADGAADPPYQNMPTVADYSEADYLKYQLFVSCQPIQVKIEHTSPIANRAGMTEPRLRPLIRQWLQQEQIRVAEEFSLRYPSHLSIRVREANGITELSVDFVKALIDPITDLPGFSMTWGKSVMIPPGHERLLGPTLMDLMEEFVATFQDVNAEACG